ncbi:MAG: hypothetical protein Q8861_16390 [Bacteroidota bacterium]|nr:hypothetical protein [Bacteroidota bacterium]
MKPSLLKFRKSVSENIIKRMLLIPKSVSGKVEIEESAKIVESEIDKDNAGIVLKAVKIIRCTRWFDWG